MRREVLEGWPVRAFETVDCHGRLGHRGSAISPQHTIADMLRLADLCGTKPIVSSAHAGVGLDFRSGNDKVMQTMRQFTGLIDGSCTVNPRVPSYEIRDEFECSTEAGMIANQGAMFRTLRCRGRRSSRTSASAASGAELESTIRTTQVTGLRSWRAIIQAPMCRSFWDIPAAATRAPSSRQIWRT